MDVKNLSLITKLLSYPSRIIRRSLFKQADIIVSASLDYIQNSQIADIYNRYPEKFIEIPFGVDLKKFQTRLIPLKSDNKVEAYAKKIVNYVKDKFIRKNSLNLIFVGGLDKAHYFKGISILLNSLFLLEPKSWRLQIIGDGDMRAEYETLSKNLNLDNRVKFKGKLTDTELIKAIQDSDLLILPSINNNEAFGIVLIEALACGVPVIASDLPGVRRVFTDKQEGLLFETGNVQDLKNKIEFILKHEDERKKMALAARELAEKKYSLGTMENNLKKLFKD